MNKGFQYNMATGRTVLPAAVIVSLALYALRFHDYYHLSGIVICMLSSYLLAGLNSAFGIIRTRSYLAPALFMFMYSAYSFMFDYHNIMVSLIPLLFIGSIFFIIRGYESNNVPVDVFNSFLCASLACISDSNMLVTVPVLFVSMVQLKSMNSRGLPAAVLGFAAPYWMITGYYFLTDRVDEIGNVMLGLFCVNLLDFNSINLINILFISIILIIFISVSILAGKVSLKDKVKNRSIIKNLNTMGTYLFISVLVVPAFGISLLPMMMLITAILFGYVMTQIYNRFTLILLISTLLTVSAVAVYGSIV